MKPISAINRLLNRLQARFRSARSGSVLILVVALLVLMALLGTAFISTARIDRYSAVVNSANTEIELLVQGVINMAVGNVVDDLYDPNPNAAFNNARDYRKPPLDGGSLAAAYEHHDSPAIDLFLASRVPTPLNPLSPVTATTGTNPPTWHGVSWPLIARADGTYWFDRPGDRSISLANGKRNIAFSPTFVPTAAGQVPALQPWLRAANGTWTQVTGPDFPFRAADVDGDGFADAGLWKIPMGAIDGITYYAAARIVDNNSAINVNTALSRNADFGASPYTAINTAMFFPSRVGLAEMLKTYNPGMSTLFGGTSPGAEMNRMNAFRFNGVTPPLANPMWDDGSAPSPDFDFMSVGDALNSQVARRVKFPGRNTAAALYQTYGIGESMTLAYRGGLRNPNTGASQLEQHLQESLIDGVPVPGQYGQTPAEVLNWYNDLFNYELETQTPTPVPSTFRPLRSLLVASNPVANQVPANFAIIADVNNDGLRNDLPPGVAGSGMAPYVTAGGQQQPNPPRVSINTALFGDLYRAFWNVMIEEAELAPVDATLTLFDASGMGDARKDPYYGQRFDPAPPYTSDPSEQNPARMFRTLIRDTRMPYGGPGGINRMLPEDVLKVRAALAAVNAIDLRDSDDDVTEETITVNWIRSNPSDAAVEATQVRVYGTEAQPFITEVYANLNTGDVPGLGANPNGYVAIELSNPYPVAIELKGAAGSPGWSVGLIDRRVTPVKTELTVEPLDPDGIRFDFDDGIIVPAADAVGPGKLILENFNPAGASEGSATYRPESTGLLATGAVPGTVYVPYLHRVFENETDASEPGGEFVLLRPRSGAGVAVTGPDLNNDGTPDFNEVANLYDLIPADSFDFTGMFLNGPGPVAPEPTWHLWMHYVRENGPGFDWRFVYPGRYDASASVDPHPELGAPHSNPRHQGVQIAAVGGTGGILDADILPQKPVALGAVDPVPPGAGYYTNPFTIQVANQDFGGHNKIGSVTPAQFPFGAFARDGDILQVPFIGAYIIDSPSGAVPGAFLEMNSLSMDSVLAEDTDTANDPVAADTGIQDREQIGRFYPIARNTNTPSVPAGQTDDFHDGVADANAPPDYNLPGEYWDFTQSGNDPTVTTTYVPQWRYRWAMDLFDHITVQAPHDDYFPNMNKSVHTTVQPVSNSGGGVAGDSTNTQITVREAEHREPIEGLINISTASWKVLSALPLVISDGTTATPRSGPAPAAGEVFPGMTRELAKVIVYYRDVDADPFTAGNQPHGPFKTIMELNKVVDTRPPALGGPAATVELNERPGFRNAMGTIDFTGGAANDLDDEQGDFSPQNTRPIPLDGVRADFEEKSLALSRISNLITTRSDSFTCYILVQGYRDAESANPELIVERRVAFLLDRSGTVPAFPQPVVTKIPNN